MMHQQSHFFRVCATGVPSLPAATGPSISTSIYETPSGLASLIWSRNLFGLSLRAHLPVTCAAEYDDDSPLEMQIRPWLLWKRRGTRRFDFKIGPQRRTIDVVWDLTHARFPFAGSPEPCSGFFVAFSVDGEISLVAGNMGDEAQRKLKTICRSPGILVTRRECALLKGDQRKSTYRTAVMIWGKEREIMIEIRGKQKQADGLFVSVDGTKVLQVRPLRWKFRGSEQVEIDNHDGRRMLISWDLYAWFFLCKENPPPSSAAIFVFCFEGDEDENGVSGQKAMEAPSGGRGVVSGYIGGNRNWSGRISGVRDDGRKGRKKILLKTSSLSSSSSASSAASSSVTDWASPEEEEMRGVDGFTLVVHAWRT